jgi:hypothetical protein
MKALATLALTVSFVVVAIHAEPDGTGQHALERFLSNRPLLTSYRALRRLEASTLGGKMQASLEAWTLRGRDRTLRLRGDSGGRAPASFRITCFIRRSKRNSRISTTERSARSS